jgi:hypothetical protein
VTWNGQDYYCDNCCCLVSATKDEPVCDSLAYAPGVRPGYDLCPGCAEDEEMEEERLGSNDMPERVKRYARNRLTLL